jgi:hypothetical protein
MTKGVRTSGSAKFCAPAFEPVLAGGRTTVTPSPRAIAPVSSVEKSSTTMISEGGTV